MMASLKCILTLAILALNLSLSQAQQLANNPGTCNADDGKYRTDTTGKTFKLVCNFSGTDVLSSGLRPTYGACIDACGLDPNCKGVNYTPANRSCIFLKAGTKGTTASPGTHNAYLAEDPSKVTPVTPPVTSPVAPPTKSPATSPVPAPPTAPPIDITTDPKCPETDGKVFVADDGTYYNIQCGFHADGTEVGKLTGVATFGECMKKCSETNGCLSVQYIAPPGSPGYINYECVLSTGEGPGTTTCAHWFAYTIDPPATEEDKPYPYTLCETSCPISDGLTYESETGETFKMACGRRHGTKILWPLTTETFQDCMDTCGKVLACHSVDYQARTKKCYLGNHHGPPGVAAPGFASATTLGCAGACSRSCGCPAGAKA